MTGNTNLLPRVGPFLVSRLGAGGGGGTETVPQHLCVVLQPFLVLH